MHRGGGHTQGGKTSYTQMGRGRGHRMVVAVKFLEEGSWGLVRYSSWLQDLCLAKNSPGRKEDRAPITYFVFMTTLAELEVRGMEPQKIYSAEPLFVIPFLQGAINPEGGSMTSQPALPSYSSPQFLTPDELCFDSTHSPLYELVTNASNRSFCGKKFCFFSKDGHSNVGLFSPNKAWNCLYQLSYIAIFVMAGKETAELDRQTGDTGLATVVASEK